MPCAVQSQCRPSPPHPPAKVQGHELARLRCQPARARKLDDVVHRRGHRVLEGRAPDDTGRAADLLWSGHPDGPDLEGGIPARPAPNRRADRLRHRPARARPRRPRPQHAEPARRDGGGAAPTRLPRRRPSPPVGRQHRAEAVRGRRVLHERHGTRVRRSWRKLHLGVDAGTRRIVASLLTTRDVDDATQVGPLLDRIDEPLASFTGDGAYDQEGVTTSIGSHHPDAAIVVPPRSTAVPSEAAETAPTQRDRHLRDLAEHGRLAWQATPSVPGPRRPCPQPHAGPRTPELRPHRLNLDRARAHRVHPADPCNNATPAPALVRVGRRVPRHGPQLVFEPNEMAAAQCGSVRLRPLCRLCPKFCDTASSRARVEERGCRRMPSFCDDLCDTLGLAILTNVSTSHRTSL